MERADLNDRHTGYGEQAFVPTNKMPETGKATQEAEKPFAGRAVTWNRQFHYAGTVHATKEGSSSDFYPLRKAFLLFISCHGTWDTNGVEGMVEDKDSHYY